MYQKKIAEQVEIASQKTEQTIEIGPGTGALTKWIHQIKNLFLVEIDKDMVKVINQKFPQLKSKIIQEDFLKIDLNKEFKQNISIVGNFAYNIASQIFFKALENKNQVKEVVCMIQKEVAERITSKPKTKKYGILSVLLQAYYNTEYLFNVPADAFSPPPKVISAVIKLSRNNTKEIPCNQKLFFQVVKLAFAMRRKTLKNALKCLKVENVIDKEILKLRAEQLTVDQFIKITSQIEESQKA